MEYVIYHDDVDGFTAAWIFGRHRACIRRMRGQENQPMPTFIPVQYGDDPPELDRTPPLKIRIVDFSYPRETLIQLYEESDEMTVLDHHKTAEKDLAPGDDHSMDFCRFNQNECGATMAWEYIYGAYPPPRFVQYVKDWDLRQFKLPFSHILRAAVHSYEMTFTDWDFLHNAFEREHLLQGLRHEGEAILRRDEKDIKKAVDASFPLRLGGLAGLATWMTQKDLVSEIGHRLCRETLTDLKSAGTFGACLIPRDRNIEVSLRSLEGGIDVSDLAKKYGGGGHRHAAGFEMTWKELGDPRKVLEEMRVGV